MGLTRYYYLFLCCWVLGVAAWPAHAGLLADLRIEQGIIRNTYTYDAAPTVTISFTLAQQAQVTVFISRHLAVGDAQAEYLAEPYTVRTLQLGWLDAGRRQASWDGMNEQGRPVTETRLAYPAWNNAGNPAEETLTQELPVALYRVTVQAGKSLLAANFHLATGVVDPNRRIGTFQGAVRDSTGRLIVAARPNARGERFSTSWQSEQKYPTGADARQVSPLACWDVAVDSRDHLYVMALNGVFKYDADGAPLAWEGDADYLNCPYPAMTRNQLGVRLEKNAKGPTRYIFGPGAGGAGNKFFDGKVVQDQPGFAYRWGGLAIDAADQLYLVRQQPDPQIQVFDARGEFLRALPLPPAQYQSLRFGKDGTLWVPTGSKLLGLDAHTGKLLKTVDKAFGHCIHLGPDGAIYLFDGSDARLCRFTPLGDPWPFTADSPCAQGNMLNLSPEANNVPTRAAGYSVAIWGVAATPNGDFYLASSPTADFDGNRLLHFAADGAYLPEPLTVALAPATPGNVFLDDAPATLHLYVENYQPQDAPLTVDWTVTDIDGKQTAGHTALSARAAASQTLPLEVDAPERGHYRLQVTVHQAEQTIAVLNTTLARIRSRVLSLTPDSPFGMCWGGNFYLMGLAGVKLERVGSQTFSMLEPREGLTMPDPPEAMQAGQGIDGYRRYAARWGVLPGETFAYGEQWLGGGFPNCRIYSYDRFIKYMLRVTDRFRGGNVPFYQFWNEPNNLWDVPGPFAREHFSLLAQIAWNVVKARDKNALVFPDSNAGESLGISELALYGAGKYIDAVALRHPPLQPLHLDAMVLPGQPEGKLAYLQQVSSIRDKAYPGKPVWNTADGWVAGNTASVDLGAVMIPRVYISQLAAGVEKIFWYAQSAVDDPTCLLAYPDNTPYPSYCSYATMTRLLEGTEYLGPVDLHAHGAYGYLFGHGDTAILAAWSVQGTQAISLNAGVEAATRIDLMDRETLLTAVAGALPLTLSERVQYLLLPRNAWVAGITHTELDRQLAALNVKNAAALPGAITAASGAAPPDMARLTELLRAAKQAALAGAAPNGAPRSVDLARDVRTAIEEREGADGYQRNARLALTWTTRLARAAVYQRDEVARGMIWAAGQAAEAAQILSLAETPAYPGVTLTAFIGAPTEVTAIRRTTPIRGDLETTIDDKFNFEIPRKGGDTLDLELTVWNFYTHRIVGTVAPRLPAGWTTTRPQAEFAVNPGEFQRFLFTISIPATTTPDRYPVGGLITYQDTPVREIHVQRVKVE